MIFQLFLSFTHKPNFRFSSFQLGAPDIRKKVAASSSKGAVATVAASQQQQAATTKAGSATATSTGGSISKNETHTNSFGTVDKFAAEAASSSVNNNDNNNNNNNLFSSTSSGNNTDVGGIYAGGMSVDKRGLMVKNNYESNQQQHQQQQNFNYEQQQYQQQHQYQYQQQRQQQHQHQYQKHYDSVNCNNNINSNSNNNAVAPTFDDYVAAPPEELETQGLSFGSIAMTDAEMNRLQQVGRYSISIPNNNNHVNDYNNNHQNNNYTSSTNTNTTNNYQNNTNTNTTNNYQNNNYNNNSAAVHPPTTDGTLEPTGISIGDISMMSAGTNFQMKLEDVGTSFGTMMSYNTLNTADMIGGGLLEAVGTSFGSLSIDMTGNNNNNRDKLYKTLEIAASGPMFHPQEQKNSSNLLDCSDSESENSVDKEKLTKQKSQAWEMMKTSLKHQTSKGSIGSQDLMPPPSGAIGGLSSTAHQQYHQHQQDRRQNSYNTNVTDAKSDPSAHHHPTFENIEVALPTTTMESNFSTLSAWSAADDDFNPDNENNEPPTLSPTVTHNDSTEEDVIAPPPPPPQLTKTDSF